MAAESPPARKRLPLGKPVRLRGTLWPEKHYGAPGYGEDKVHDPLLTIYALRLDAPIDLINRDNPAMTANIAPIERVQVDFDDADDRRVVQAAADQRHVEVEGELHQSIHNDFLDATLTASKLTILSK